MRIVDNSSEFNEIISEGITLVDFYATWCGPCRMIAPIIEEIDEQLHDKINVLKVDVDELGELASSYGITSIPTLILFKNGKLKSKIIGFVVKDEIMEEINKLLLK